MKIVPTVGRVLHFRPAAGDVLSGMLRDSNQPLAALVAHVNSDDTVNLAVFDRDGNQHARQRVLLVQPDEPKPEDVSFCHWMPYQAGQSAAVGSDIGNRVAQLEEALPAGIAAAGERIGAVETDLSSTKSTVSSLGSSVSSVSSRVSELESMRRTPPTDAPRDDAALRTGAASGGTSTAPNSLGAGKPEGDAG